MVESEDFGAVDSYDITVTVLTSSAAAQEALFDLLADVAHSWGERHNVELSVAGRPSSDDGYRECVGCGFEWFEGRSDAPETHRSDCPVAALVGSSKGEANG